MMYIVILFLSLLTKGGVPPPKNMDINPVILTVRDQIVAPKFQCRTLTGECYKLNVNIEGSTLKLGNVAIALTQIPKRVRDNKVRHHFLVNFATKDGLCTGSLISFGKRFRKWQNGFMTCGSTELIFLPACATCGEYFVSVNQLGGTVPAKPTPPTKPTQPTKGRCGQPPAGKQFRSNKNTNSVCQNITCKIDECFEDVKGRCGQPPARKKFRSNKHANTICQNATCKIDECFEDVKDRCGRPPVGRQFRSNKHANSVCQSITCRPDECFDDVVVKGRCGSPPVGKTFKRGKRADSLCRSSKCTESECFLSNTAGHQGQCWNGRLTMEQRDARCAGDLVCARRGFDGRDFGDCVRKHCCSRVQGFPLGSSKCWTRRTSVEIRDGRCLGDAVCARIGRDQRKFGCRNNHCCIMPPNRL